MNKNVDINMYNIITGWGIPDIDKLKDMDIKFIFNEKDIEDKRYCNGLHCFKSSVKFCLYDITNGKVIFVMDFFGGGESIINRLKPEEAKNVNLQLLNVVEPKLRKRGIATYYIRKLSEYIEEKNLSYIVVYPDANNEAFEGQDLSNSLNQQELEGFYKKFPNIRFKQNFEVSELNNEDVRVIKKLINELNDITRYINTLRGFEATFRATVETFDIKVIKDNQYVYGCYKTLTEENLKEKIKDLNYLIEKEWRL